VRVAQEHPKYMIPLLLIMNLLLATTVIFGQETAEEWFKRGVEASESGEKIVNYKRAIELDPFFLEAYYNLGLIYKKQGLYNNAEESFRLALAANSERIQPAMKLKILYELGITYKRLNRFDEAKASLVEANNLATSSKLRATIWYEIGLLSILQKQFDEAIIQLNEGLKEDPTNTIQFQQAIQLAKIRKSAEILYQQGLAFLQEQKNDEALAAFKQIQQIAPNYENVAEQIARLESAGKPAAAEKAPDLDALYSQADDFLTDKKYEQAIRLFQQILAADSNYKDVHKKLETAQEQQQVAQLQPQLEEDYQRGMQALRRKDYLEALFALEKVRSLDPNYKSVIWGINKAKSGFREAQAAQSQISQQNVLNKYYAQGVDALKNEKWAEAIGAFEMVAQVNSNFKDTQKLLAQAREKLDAANQAMLAQAESEIKTKEARLYYKQGLTNMQREEWVQAVIAFEKAEVLQADLPDLQSNLALARQRLNELDALKTETVTPVDSMKLLPISWSALFMVILLIFVFLGGLLYFLPATRARFFLIRGKYDRAKPIYESMLTTRPGDPKLYITLANIYLLENRKDEPAIRIYEAVLRMNLNTQRNEDIKSILREYYKNRKVDLSSNDDIVDAAINPTLNQIKKENTNPDSGEK